MSSNTLPSRAAAQNPLHKMYTFVYRTFIKFILFCRGQALDAYVLRLRLLCTKGVSMPSRAWVVTDYALQEIYILVFQCPHGLELLLEELKAYRVALTVSMPSRAWVVTARMSNILNFLWYFRKRSIVGIPTIERLLTKMKCSFIEGTLYAFHARFLW